MQFKKPKRVCKWIPTGKDYPKMQCVWIDVEQTQTENEVVENATASTSTKTKQLQFSTK